MCSYLHPLPEYKGLHFKSLNCFVSDVEMAYFKNLLLSLPHLRVFFLHTIDSLILQLHRTKAASFASEQVTIVK